MRKRLFSLLAVTTFAALLMLTTGMSVFAETSGSLTATISYTLDDNGNLTITGSGAMPDYEASGTQSPFQSNNDIKTASIGNGITDIGYALFRNCKELEQVSVPASAAAISAQAFDGCNNLKTVNLQNGLKRMGDAAFSECRSLTNITIPDSVTEIGSGIFSYCSKMKSVKLSANLKVIPESAFTGTLLKAVSLPEGTEEIGMYAFQFCANLREITIPGNVKRIKEGAFSECFSLDQVTFKGDSPVFDDWVFYSDDFTAYYPKNNKTWTQDIFDLPHCGKIKWVGLCSHAAGSAVVENRKEATALAAGSYDSVVYCKYCHKEMNRKTISIPKLRATIKLSAKKKTLKKGKTYKLKTANLARGDGIKSFKSSKKKVAAVTSKGVIKAKKKGTAVITVTLKSGNTANCKITVK